MKVLERVLEKRIRCQVSIDNMQFDFMPNKGTTDAIFSMRQVQEKYQAKKKLLYADNLVLMAPSMEQLDRRVAEWRAILLGKGLKVDAGKSKVMVDRGGGKMIVNSGKWPCEVCGKGVQEFENFVQCTVCKKNNSQVVQW